MAVIKQSDRPQFFNQRIGINRFDSNSQAPWEALSNAAGDVAKLAVTKLYNEALESGAEKGYAANLIITDTGGAPRALTAPKNLSPTEQRAYQDVVDQRYLFNINNALKNKSQELETKHPYDVEGFSKAFSTFATGLAQTSGKKWGARINDISINMLAMSKLNIESATSEKIFKETQSGIKNDFDLIIQQMGQSAEIGGSLTDPESRKEGSPPLAISYYSQLQNYLKSSLKAGMISKEEAEKYQQTALTNMAMGSVNFLFNQTNSKIERDIAEAFIISGNMSGFNMLTPDVQRGLIEMRQFVNKLDGGNLKQISSHITNVADPLNDKSAFVKSQIKQKIEANESIVKKWHNYSLSLGEGLRKKAEIAALAFKNSIEANRASNKLALENARKQLKNNNQVTARKFINFNGHTQEIFSKIYTLKNSIENIPDKFVNKFEVLTEGVKIILNDSYDQLELFASEEYGQALSPSQVTDEFIKIKKAIATSMFDMFQNEIGFKATDIETFENILLGNELPRNQGENFAATIINSVFPDRKDIKTFVSTYKPTERQKLQEKMYVENKWQALNSNIFAVNHNDEQAINNLVEQITNFNNDPAIRKYLTKIQLDDARKKIATFKLKQNISKNIASFDSNNVNTLQLLINNQVPLKWPSDPKEYNIEQQQLVEIAKGIKKFTEPKNQMPVVDAGHLVTWLGSIEAAKSAREQSLKEQEELELITSDINSGIIDANRNLNDYSNAIDKQIGNNLPEIIKQANTNDVLNNTLRTYGSNILNTELKNLIKGNINQNYTNDFYNDLITNYRLGTMRLKSGPEFNNFVKKGFLTQEEANHLDLMILLKNQPGVEEKSYQQVSLEISNMRNKYNREIESDERRVLTRTASELLYRASGIRKSALKGTHVNQLKDKLTMAHKNFERKYNSVVEYYMSVGVGETQIKSIMEEKWENEYNTPTNFVFENNGINNINDIQNNKKFVTQYSIPKYFNEDSEADWFVETSEKFLNEAGFSLYDNKENFQRAVLIPYDKSDSDTQIFHPWTVDRNGALSPAFYERIIGHPSEAETETILLSFPTFSPQFLEWKDLEQERIRNEMSKVVKETDQIYSEPLGVTIMKGLARSASPFLIIQGQE